MYTNIKFDEARDILLSLIRTMHTERVPLERACGRVLAEDYKALSDIPQFDRSPYDGYALRTGDTMSASRQKPVTLKILEEIPAGRVPTKTVKPGTAVKILTGSPVPEGADGVIKYEYTEFTDETVTLFAPVKEHDIIRRGEDVLAGTPLAHKGDLIDSATLGTLAAQGIGAPLVYETPRIGVVSTGDELTGIDDELPAGKIRDTNRYMLLGALELLGVEPVWLGSARDSAPEIAELLRKGMDECDAVVSTGGASVGDYDATIHAIEIAGLDIAIRKLNCRPGGACAYAVRDGKPMFCLSGNPAAAMVNFYAVVLPCVKKLRGLTQTVSEVIVTIAEDFNKVSPLERIIRGRLDLSGGEALMRVAGQGNAMLHSTIGCNVIAVIPAGTRRVPAGTRLRAYTI